MKPSTIVTAPRVSDVALSDWPAKLRVEPFSVMGAKSLMRSGSARLLLLMVSWARLTSIAEVAVTRPESISWKVPPATMVGAV